MRIIILTQYFLPEMGAPQSRLFELAKGLQQLGWEVSVVTSMPNYPTGKIFKGYRWRWSSKEYIESIETKRHWFYASNSKRAMPRIISMLSFAIMALFSYPFIRSRRPSFLFVESPPLLLAFSGWLLARWSSSRMIMNVSDLWPLSAKELGAIGEGRLYRFLERAEHFLYRKAFLCTGQSQQIVDHIRKTKFKNTYLFRNGVDSSRFNAGLYDPGKRNYLVYAGLLGVAQGILAICRNVNFKTLGVTFHIYGAGAEQDEIETFLKGNPDLGIQYKGTIARAEMPATLCSYGGTIIPLVKNIHGAVPSKIYEAMAAGLPILFSGEGEGADMVQNQKAGWVNSPGHWTALAGNIMRFVNLAEHDFLSLRAQNKMTAEMHYNRNRQIKELSDHLTSLS